MKLFRYLHWGKIKSMVIGAFIIATAIHLFILPQQIIEGGMLGVGLLASYISPVPSGVAILLLSLPVYIVTWFYHPGLLWYNLTGVILLTGLLDIYGFFPIPPLLPPLYSAIAGGSMVGIGVGILLLNNITTDGIDLLANLLSYRTNINVGVLIFTFDLIILCGGMLVLNRGEVILSGITITAIGVVTTLLTYNNKKRHHLH